MPKIQEIENIQRVQLRYMDILLCNIYASDTKKKLRRKKIISKNNKIFYIFLYLYMILLKVNINYISIFITFKNVKILLYRNNKISLQQTVSKRFADFANSLVNNHTPAYHESADYNYWGKIRYGFLRRCLSTKK